MADEKSETEAKSEAQSAEPKAAAKPHAHENHSQENGHSDHPHDAGHAGHASVGEHVHDHGLAHTMPIPLLVGVLGALMALTLLTVSVTHYDLGSEGNLVIAMVIATVKAGLVVTFFMHLLWDKKFHLILFLTALLFVVLFLSMSSTDRSEYQPRIDEYSQTQAP
ncbi:MAG TPA: cytochrome C oxidase subunit IV family protein [Polyangiaceae bacterium]|jgi:cytochrome c oxidase subunit 4